MSFGGRGRLLLLLFLFINISSVAEAASWQINPFLNSLKGSVYEFDYLVEGLKSVHSFDFVTGTEAQYQGFFNRMTLGLGIGDVAHRIQTLEKLEPTDFGTLAHESFHAFKANFIDVNPQYKEMKIWMKRRAEVVFDELFRSKRETALEEAYAVFIDNAVSARMGVEKMLEKITLEKCSHIKMIARLWDVSWNAEVTGYYYRDGLGEYWADHFSELWTKLVRGGDSYQNTNRDKTIFTQSAISELDKEWISLHLLLKSRVSSSFQETFGQEKAVLLCSK